MKRIHIMTWFSAAVAAILLFGSAAPANAGIFNGSCFGSYECPDFPPPTGNEPGPALPGTADGSAAPADERDDESPEENDSEEGRPGNGDSGVAPPDESDEQAGETPGSRDDSAGEPDNAADPQDESLPDIAFAAQAAVDFAVDPLGTRAYAVREDHSLWVWGDLEDYEMSDFQRAGSFEPSPYSGLKAVKSLVPGSGNVMFAVFQDGTVAGKGTPSSKTVLPIANEKLSKYWNTIPGLKHVESIASGRSHVLAVRKDGTVVAWGNNQAFQLGTNELKESAKPVQVPGLSGIVAVAAGKTHSVALDRKGRIWEWGSRSDGSAIEAPRQVTGLRQAVEIAAGGDLSLARLKDGSLWFWGTNYGKTLFKDADQMRRDEAEADGPVIYSPHNVYETEGPTFRSDTPYMLADKVRNIAGVHSQAIQLPMMEDFPLTTVYFTQDDGTLWMWDTFRVITIKNGLEITDDEDVKTVPYDHPDYRPEVQRFTRQGVEVIRQDDAAIRLRAIPELTNVRKVSKGRGTVMFLLEDHTIWGYAPDGSEPSSVLAHDPRLGGAKGNYVPANRFNYGITVTLNSAPLGLDPAPVMLNGSVMLPMRALFDPLGAAISFDAASQQVKGTLGSNTIAVQANSKRMYVNGKAKQLTTAPVNINGKLFIPLETIHETIVRTADWDEVSRTVTIYR